MAVGRKFAFLARFGSGRLNPKRLSFGFLRPMPVLLAAAARSGAHKPLAADKAAAARPGQGRFRWSCRLHGPCPA